MIWPHQLQAVALGTARRVDKLGMAASPFKAYPLTAKQRERKARLAKEKRTNITAERMNYETVDIR